MNSNSRWFLIFPILVIIFNGWHLFRDDPDSRSTAPRRSKTTANAKTLIVPNKSFLGIKIGTPEKEVRKKLGPPNGYVALNSQTNAAIYGTTTALIFKRTSSRNPHRIFAHGLVLTDPFQIRNTSFTKTNWAFPNGITTGDTLQKVEPSLAISSSQKGPARMTATTKHTRMVKVPFTSIFPSARTRPEDDESAYSLANFSNILPIAPPHHHENAHHSLPDPHFHRSRQ